jgi:hypothetical protein
MPFRCGCSAPPVTHSLGRVLFWSYAYYLSRYLHMTRGVCSRCSGHAARHPCPALVVAGGGRKAPVPELPPPSEEREDMTTSTI